MWTAALSKLRVLDLCDGRGAMTQVLPQAHHEPQRVSVVREDGGA